MVMRSDKAGISQLIILATVVIGALTFSSSAQAQTPAEQRAYEQYRSDYQRYLAQVERQRRVDLEFVSANIGVGAVLGTQSAGVRIEINGGPAFEIGLSDWFIMPSIGYSLSIDYPRILDEEGAEASDETFYGHYGQLGGRIGYLSDEFIEIDAFVALIAGGDFGGFAFGFRAGVRLLFYNFFGFEIAYWGFTHFDDFVSQFFGGVSIDIPEGLMTL